MEKRLRAVVDMLMRMDRLHEDAAKLYALIHTLDTVRGDRLPPQTDVLLNDLELVLGGPTCIRCNALYGNDATAL